MNEKKKQKQKQKRLEKKRRKLRYCIKWISIQLACVFLGGCLLYFVLDIMKPNYQENDFLSDEGRCVSIEYKREVFWNFTPGSIDRNVVYLTFENGHRYVILPDETHFFQYAEFEENYLGNNMQILYTTDTGYGDAYRLGDIRDDNMVYLDRYEFNNYRRAYKNTGVLVVQGLAIGLLTILDVICLSCLSPSKVSSKKKRKKE